MAGVKSFRIDDLLVGKTTTITMEEKSKEEDATPGKSGDTSRSAKGQPHRNENLARSPTQPGKSNKAHPPPLSPPRISPAGEGLAFGGSPSNVRPGAKVSSPPRLYPNVVSGGGILPYSAGIPMLYPVGPIPSAAGIPFVHDGMKPHSYTNILSYASYDNRLKQSGRPVFGPHSDSNISLVPSYPAFPSGHYASSLEYMYPGFIGHFSVPLAGGVPDALHDKRHFINDRMHYPLYSMSRSAGYPSSCKRKGGQIRFNNSQTAQLEKSFVQQKYLNANDRKKLAQSLGLTDRQVKTWFQNRRAKLRKCKGGVCAESEVSGSPHNSCRTSPNYDTRYDDDSPLDMKDDD